MPPRPRLRWGLAGLSLLAVVGSAWLLLRPAAAPTAVPQAGSAAWPPARWAALGETADAGALPAASTPASAGLRDPDTLLRQLFGTGSLRGAALDGGWGRFEGGVLQPSLALRQRFDQLLTTLGEASLPELRQLVQALARRDLGPAGADAVLAVWDAYIALQQQPRQVELDPTRPDTWLAVLNAQAAARRQALGPAWADAFYRDEEGAFRGWAEARVAASGPATGSATSAGDGAVGPGTSTAAPPAWQAQPGVPAEQLYRQRAQAYGAAAAQRLAEQDQVQNQWQARVEAARQTVARLRQAPELSEPQRREAIERWLAQSFDARDQLRIRALLAL